jgi:hypothetical protein
LSLKRHVAGMRHARATLARVFFRIRNRIPISARIVQTKSTRPPKMRSGSALSHGETLRRKINGQRREPLTAPPRPQTVSDPAGRTVTPGTGDAAVNEYTDRSVQSACNDGCVCCRTAVRFDATSSWSTESSSICGTQRRSPEASSNGGQIQNCNPIQSLLRRRLVNLDYSSLSHCDDTVSASVRRQPDGAFPLWQNHPTDAGRSP